MGSKEVSEKAITAYTEKRNNVGKWFEEAVIEGNGLVEVFQNSSIDQGEPANRVKREMDKLRKEKERVDQLWLDAQQKKKAKAEQENEAGEQAEKKAAVKKATHLAAAAVPKARPETEGKEASPPPTTCLLYTSPSPRDATLSRMPSSA